MFLVTNLSPTADTFITYTYILTAYVYSIYYTILPIHTYTQILSAAVWVVTEYPSILTLITRDIHTDTDEEGEYVYWVLSPYNEERRSIYRGQNLLVVRIMTLLLNPQNLGEYTSETVIVYLHAAMKLFVYATKECNEVVLRSVISVLRTNLGIFAKVSICVCTHVYMCMHSHICVYTLCMLSM